MKRTRNSAIMLMVLTCTVGCALHEPETRTGPGSISELVQRLESGEIGPGAIEDPRPLSPSKPWVYIEYRDEQMHGFGVMSFRDRHRVVTLYWSAGTGVFAASLLEGAGNPMRQKWFFCDDDLLAEFIAMTMFLSRPPATSS